MIDATVFTLALATAAFLFDETPPYQDVIARITQTLTEVTLKDILVYAIGAAIGFVLFWFAVRKVSGIVQRAFKRGKLRL